jgi:hypothetical protein
MLSALHQIVATDYIPNASQAENLKILLIIEHGNDRGTSLS